MDIEALKYYQNALPQCTEDEIRLLCTMAPLVTSASQEKGLVTHLSRTEIVTQEFGTPPTEKQQAIREQLALCAIRLFIQMDDHFDRSRNLFPASELQHPQLLLNRILNIRLAFEGKATPKVVKVADVHTFLLKAVTSPALYSETTQALLLKDLHNLETEVIPTVAELESQAHDLTTEQALRLRSVTITHTARLSFDLVFGQYHNHPQYSVAKDRYCAAILAIQLADDVLDLHEDINLSVANPLLAALAETGENSYIQAIPTPAETPHYFQRLSQVAPHAYERLQRIQSAHLALANSQHLNRSTFVLPAITH